MGSRHFYKKGFDPLEAFEHFDPSQPRLHSNANTPASRVCVPIFRQRPAPKPLKNVSAVIKAAIYVGVLIAPFCQPGISFGAEPMTLEEALASAYVSNPQLEAQRASLRATDEEVAKALAGWRPSVGLAGSYGWQQQRQTLLGAQSTTSIPQSQQMTLSQPIFDGRTIPSTAHAKDLVDAGRAELQATEQTVLFNATSAYFAVLRDMQIVEVYHQDIERLKAILKNTETRLKIGDLTKTDASQASARLLGSQMNLAAAEQQLSASRAAFEHLIGRPAETLMEHPLPDLPVDHTNALDIALAHNPTIAQSRAQERAADHNIDTAVGALLPSVSVQAQYGRSIDEIAPGVSQNGASIIGRLTIPIYQGGSEEASIRQAKEQHTQALLTSYDTERQVREDFENAWSALQTSRKAAELATKQADDNGVAYQGAIMESQVGARNVIDILNAEQEFLQSKVTAITQREASVTAGFKVLAAMGSMTGQHLKLPVPMYDPTQHYDQDATRWFGLGD